MDADGNGDEMSDHIHRVQRMYRSTRFEGRCGGPGPCRIVDSCRCGAERVTLAHVPAYGAEPIATSKPGPWQGGAP